MHELPFRPGNSFDDGLVSKTQPVHLNKSVTFEPVFAICVFKLRIFVAAGMVGLLAMVAQLKG